MSAKEHEVAKLVACLLDDGDTDDTDAAGETMQAAVELLQDLGATYEHPGWINVNAGGLVFAFGDANGNWGGNYGPPEDPGENGIERSLPITANADQLAQYIRQAVRKVLAGGEN